MAETTLINTPVFFDTNILLYLFDRSSQLKHQVALRLFDKHQQNETLRLSLQVVNEFAVNLLSRKFAVPWATVADVVDDLLALRVIPAEERDTRAALQLVGKFRINFWDGLILATAAREGCTVLYSEDFQHGRKYDDVEVVNPFLGNPA
jgi:predicted nucleic acid-binding protein